MLKDINIIDINIKIVKNFHYNQFASGRVENSVTETITVPKSIKQDCVLSHDLFNLYRKIYRNASMI